MPDFVQSRDRVEAALVAELVGPKPAGKPLDTSAALRFASWEQARGPWHDQSTGEEILTEAGPATRYGVGVLFNAQPSAGNGTREDEDQVGEDEIPDDKRMPETDFAKLSASIADSLQSANTKSADDDDFDLGSANTYRPSSMGVTCRVRLPAGSRVEVVGAFGRYRELPVSIGTAERSWYRRERVTARAVFTAADLTAHSGRRTVHEDTSAGERSGDEGLNIGVAAYSRPMDDDTGDRLVTFYVENRTPGRKDLASLFQSKFKVVAQDGAVILPYRSAGDDFSDDPEKASIAMLYRHHEMYAVGHGCAADWGGDIDGNGVAWVEAAVLPTFEAPSITSVIKSPAGDDLTVDMRVLADDCRMQDARRQIGGLLDAYESWIASRRAEIATLPQQMRETARSHLIECEVALQRMRVGWQMVQAAPQVRKAFQLANRAMLTQQARSSSSIRKAELDPDGNFVFAGSPPTSEPDSDRGFWRPFQIAFFLAVLESVSDRGSEHRDTVELIFFPTGGGKTEAYLAVAAFSMFLRRLRDNGDVGTEVLMRYTLRLLTTQQFLRASALMCAIEELRERTPELGDSEFSIGIWVGSASTPNNRKEATAKLERLSGGGENPFLLLRCPWCNAAFGAIRDQQAGRRKKYAVSGYRKIGRSVRFQCSDVTCRFSRKPLPVHVVDDDLYAARPTLVIGTIDKFALLAWKPEARALFGIDSDGRRAASPPGLIIQDELHLISGPLGSMSGLYEAVIENLCTESGLSSGKPKIVASTATIRRYREQVRNLYGRKETRLFPPHGLTADNSFFATWARNEDGSLRRGRKYVGVHGPGLGSMQTAQVRTASALLQAPMELTHDERDPWWTCLTFFNSLRELGNTLTLFQADIPTYLGGVNNRDGLDRTRQRWPRRPLELTSRLRNDEVPRAIADLEIRLGEQGCVDVCLASNIIEVGIDIDRLSLMTVVGQPKTTSQYIQVTGRVGRRWEERPGLVVTLYGAAKPRDRSHYERFRTYHERLYAQVEPTSVTPFALPVLERAVHAALVAYVRQRGPQNLKPYPVPIDVINEAAELLRQRAQCLDGVDLSDLDKILQRRIGQWEHWERTKWDANPEYGDPSNGLIRYPGTSVEEKVRGRTWEIPTSMRNVDANCRIEVTSCYAYRPGSDSDGGVDQ
ncbi:helicase-related protein [Lentzea flaviverrucosa]|uniref:Helicase conserved C-terminal domain-containing protein n=1 Tax=Lentzea flaviverrucosa TaxID=200379 RepID=A0A1H9WRS0_9PSEU|nr:helicase-related protein [Lentzea flaviverrucosa]RDI23034.1 helicase-like protein [Lentzea flaviverrucosa]SES36501.1 Helicase conserved C-terminal domain-containing protein [Lentzea flaviverrucosa]